MIYTPHGHSAGLEWIVLQVSKLPSAPPPRPYDICIDLLPSAKLAVAKLYQLTEDQRMILLDTLKRETFEASSSLPCYHSNAGPRLDIPGLAPGFAMCYC